MLKAEKRENESFSDTVKRITREVSNDWRKSFGKYSEEGGRLKKTVESQRSSAAEGLSTRQDEVLGKLEEDS